MYECFNYSTFQVVESSASQLIIKKIGSPPLVYQFADGRVCVDTSDFQVGDYVIQILRGDQVLIQKTLKIKQNLKYAPADYDPRSKAEITLEAIEAYLSGVASHQQKRVKVADKQIEYSSFDQLQKWRNYYQKEVRKEQGKKPSLRLEKLYYKGK